MRTTFDALGVAPDLAAALGARGIVHPFPIQELCIPDALAGRDVCGRAQTGSGKTLAFGLPLIQRAGKPTSRRLRGLVVVPTRELAVQVYSVLAPLAASRGIKIAAVYGGTGFDRQSKALRQGVGIVVATPGRLIDFMERGDCDLTAVTTVVLDEADRLADMGFMPQIERILKRMTQQHQTLLFSATLDRDIEQLVSRYLRDPVHLEVASTSTTVHALEHHFFAIHQKDKTRVAAAISSRPTRTLIFVRTQRGADRLARQLGELGVVAATVHGGLAQGRRQQALDDFTAGRRRVLVATDVAARGIHVDDVEVVLHYDPPSDHKGYVHRSGRTARAGAKGSVVTLVLWNQNEAVRRIQRELRLSEPILEVFSNDPRLSQLGRLERTAS